MCSSGMKNALGAIPHGIQRAEAVLEKARTHPLWTGRAARKQAYDAAHPGKYYGVGFGVIQRRFGNGAEASLAKVELSPDGRITLSHTGTEIGTGASSGQAVACARWLGRPADALDMAVTEWPDLPVETSGDPHAMSQAEQDRLAGNPRWSPAYASASSASNSSYYFSHTTREAARIVFVHGLWPAALEIWGAQVQAPALRPDDARWIDGSLTLEGREPLALSRLAAQAHARGLVVGAAVHGFNRWQWAQAEFIVDGASARIAADGLSVRYGDRATGAKQALATTPNRYQVLDRRSVSLPPTVNNNAMVGYNTAVGTLAELAVDAASGKVALLTHHTILECGDMLVPQLVSGQIQGWHRQRHRPRVARRAAALRGWSRRRHLELQPLSPAARQRRGRVGADRRCPAAAVGQRAAQRYGRGGDDPDYRGDRERHCACDRPSFSHPAGHARPSSRGVVMSPATRPLTVTVNGRRHGPMDVPEGMMMIDVLHEVLDLTGSRLGCGQGMCHACVVIWDRDDHTSEEVPACITGAAFFDGKRIRTIEGIAERNDKGEIVALSPVQQAFLDQFSFQCGYCTPGFVNAATVLIERLRRAPVPRGQVEATVAAALEKHICRCTGYVRYYQAVRDVILATPGLTRDTA